MEQESAQHQCLITQTAIPMCPLFQFLFISVLEILASAKREGKEIKKHTDWEGKNKTIFVNR